MYAMRARGCSLCLEYASISVADGSWSAVRSVSGDPWSVVRGPVVNEFVIVSCSLTEIHAAQLSTPNRHQRRGKTRNSVRGKPGHTQRQTHKHTELGGTDIMSSLREETLARWSLEGKTALVTGGTKVRLGSAMGNPWNFSRKQFFCTRAEYTQLLHVHHQ